MNSRNSGFDLIQRMAIGMTCIAYVTIAIPSAAAQNARGGQKRSDYANSVSTSTRLYDVRELIQTMTREDGETPKTTQASSMLGGGFGPGVGVKNQDANQQAVARTAKRIELQKLIELHAFRSDQPARSQGMGGMGGPAGGMGMGMGEMGMGGGMDMGGLGGMGGMGSGGSSRPQSALPICTGIAQQLVVTGSDEVHARVESLLKELLQAGRSVPVARIDLVMIPVQEEAPTDWYVADQTVLKQWASKPNGHRVSVRCGNHQSATVSSGVERSFTASVTPVVGSPQDLNAAVGGTLTHRGIGYAPQIQTVLTGIEAQIQFDVDEKTKAATIRLAAALISAPDKVETITIADGIEVERLPLSKASLETLIQTQASTNWSVAGVVPIVNPGTVFDVGVEHEQLLVLIRWQSNQDAADPAAGSGK